jgi:hypothetical protein
LLVLFEDVSDVDLEVSDKEAKRITHFSVHRAPFQDWTQRCLRCKNSRKWKWMMCPRPFICKLLVVEIKQCQTNPMNRDDTFTGV